MLNMCKFCSKNCQSIGITQCTDFKTKDPLAVELCTFPETDDSYCKWFVVEKKWLLDVLDRMDALNNRYGVDLNNFLENYDWSETDPIYHMAIAADKLIVEKEEGVF